MKTVTICGSMRFSEEMKAIALDLESRHKMNVLQCVYAPKSVSLSDNEKYALAKAHYKKIDISDGIYVVDIGGYIGESVSKEIQYAEKMGKEIIYHTLFSKET